MIWPTTNSRLFLGEGALSLHETAYGDGRRIAGRAAELADIGGSQAAFGLRASDADRDLPDHICAELELCSALLVKLAYAGEMGWKPKRNVTRRALKAFLEDHLGRWCGALATQIRDRARAGPYRELAHALETLVRLELKRAGARPRVFGSALSHDFMQEESFACPREAVPI